MQVLCLCAVFLGIVTAKPNIIFFLADDLGWNDVGFHGSNAISTPNIDALAYSGVALHNYYVTPICTPSRAALMTGKYPIHTGMQHSVIYGTEPRGLPLSETILPQHLRALGYRTHLVGKWHLGHYKREYLPLNRGFESHTGFWTGKIDMYDHTSVARGSWGFDFRRGFEVAHDLFGKYATDVYTDEAIKVIRSHNKSEPLFLMVSHSAVHSGNPYEYIRAPEDEVERFRHINDTQRRKFAAVLSKMDDSIGRVISELQANGLLDNSIVVFSTDNGGAAAGFNDNAASNYPLKGVKNTIWEGGVRGAGVLWSPLLERRARVATQRMHVVDWMPTLLAAAGGNVSSLSDLDGVDQWQALSLDLPSQRSSLVHNIDDEWGFAAITVDQWKLTKGTSYEGMWDDWLGGSEREGTYNIEAVLKERAGQAISKLELMPDLSTINQIREAVTLKCKESTQTKCNAMVAPCLFNIEEDPCEFNNLADSEPEILQRMLLELDRVNATALPPNNRPDDPLGDPKYWGRLYTNFADYATL